MTAAQLLVIQRLIEAAAPFVARAYMPRDMEALMVELEERIGDAEDLLDALPARHCGHGPSA
jgi:hypothetical protein